MLCVCISDCHTISHFSSLFESRTKMMKWMTSKFTKIFCSFFIAETIQKNLVSFSCFETEAFVGYMTHRSIFAQLLMQKQIPLLHRLHQWPQFHSLFILIQIFIFGTLKYSFMYFRTRTRKTYIFNLLQIFSKKLDNFF